jgi:CheY-like chemotaxis protein
MPGGETGLDVAKVKILVAEDEGIVALDLRRQLHDLGYQVVATVKSGQAAIERAEETRPDLVIMDIRLKGEMDGIEAASVIDERLRIPVIFASALADDDTVSRARAIGNAGFLVKPFSEEKLLAAIGGALRPGADTSRTEDVL